MKHAVSVLVLLALAAMAPSPAKADLFDFLRSGVEAVQATACTNKGVVDNFEKIRRNADPEAHGLDPNHREQVESVEDCKIEEKLAETAEEYTQAWYDLALDLISDLVRKIFNALFG